MLRKLIKHEFRATAKTFLFVYAAVVVFALANAIFSLPGIAGGMSGIAYSITILLYILSLFAAGIVTLVVVIRRFYTNLLGDEGYLMFTLPVRTEQHMAAKLITAFVWSLCSFALIVGSFSMLVMRLNLAELIYDYIDVASKAGFIIPLWTAGIVLLIAVVIAETVLILYASMAIGPNMLKNRVGGSILAFIIIEVAALIVFAVISRVVDAIPIFNPALTAAQTADANAFVAANPIFLPYKEVDVNDFGGLTDALAAYVMMLAASLIVAVACWFVTRYMLRRKLNLA